MYEIEIELLFGATLSRADIVATITSDIIDEKADFGVWDITEAFITGIVC